MEGENATRLAIGDDEQPATVVVEAVAEHLNTDPLELSPPLYHAIDFEALNLVGGISGLKVSFRYNGCHVAVDGGSAVIVSDE